MIKRLILFASFIGFYTLQTKAQTEVKFDFGLGVANMQMERFDSLEAPKGKSKVGISLGFIFSYQLNEQLFIESGAQFSSKGYREENTDDYFSGGSSSGTHLKSIHYLDFPLQIKYQLTNSKKAKPFFILGGYYGIALGGRFSSTYGSKNSFAQNLDSRNESGKLKIGNKNEDTIKPTDYGLSIGGGVSFGKVDLGLYYDLGLSNVVSKSHQASINAKNHLFRINLGLKLYSGFDKIK